MALRSSVDTEIGATIAEKAPLDERARDLIDRVIRGILHDSREVTAVGVVTCTGLPVLARLECDMDQSEVASAAAILIDLGKKAVKCFERGPLEEVVVVGRKEVSQSLVRINPDAPKQYVVTSQIDEDYILFILASGIKMGLLFKVLEDAASEIRKILAPDSVQTIERVNKQPERALKRRGAQ
jgi:predicted regulator of Ras-like GTPase activity (Roadblock/LC7/MglB family)